MRAGGRIPVRAGLRIAVALVSFGTPASALASGFDLPTVGSAQSGPVTRDAAAWFHNPAQLAYLPRAELMISAGVVVADIRYRREYRGTYQLSDTLQFQDPIDPAYVDPDKTGSWAPTVRTRPVGPVGGLFFAVPLVRDRLTLGGGVAVPYAAILDFPDDGAQRFQIRDASIASTDFGLALGARLHRVISIGAGVSYVLSFLELSKVQDFAAVDLFHDVLADPPVNQPNSFGVDAPSTVRELDVLARPIWIQNGISHGVTFNAGIALEPTERLDLALAYQHGSRVRAEGDFVLDMDDEFFTQDLAAEGLQYPAVVEGDATVSFDLPMRLTLGAGHDIHPKFRLDGFVSYVFYRRVDQFDITLRSPDLALPELGVGDTTHQALPRNWRDVINIEVNGRIRPIAAMLVSLMLGYDSPASPDSTIDAASPDGHRVLWGVGLGYTFRDRFQLLFDSKLHHMLPRTVTASDHDLGNGTYRLFIGVFGLTARVLFDFAGAKAAGARPTPEPAPAAENSPRADLGRVQEGGADAGSESGHRGRAGAGVWERPAR